MDTLSGHCDILKKIVELPSPTKNRVFFYLNYYHADVGQGRYQVLRNLFDNCKRSAVARLNSGRIEGDHLLRFVPRETHVLFERP